MRHRLKIAITALLLSVTTACSTTPPSAPGAAAKPAAPLEIVASTQVIADLVSQVAGEHATVHATVPRGADPQHYAPLPQELRQIATADLAFYNYQQYEDPRLVAVYRTSSNNPIELASEAVKHNANLIPLITDNSLNTVWLGLQASGGKDPAATVDFTATKISGPGKLAAYIVSSFGQPRVLWAASDAVVEDFGTTSLPAGAHTHLSWAFTAPGIYRMQLVAQGSTAAAPVARGEIVFAVGVDPSSDPTISDRTVIDSGHADISYQETTGELLLTGEISHAAGAHGSTHAHTHDLQLSPRETVIAVPSRTLQPVPAGNYGFLGKPGELIYQLPQAVLGRTLHGEIDPHLLGDPHNASSYLAAITASLQQALPEHSSDFAKRAAAYQKQLHEITAAHQARHAQNPHKQLITATANQNYFAAAYGYQIAATVRRNPAVEATLADHKKMLQTLSDSQVNAVFIDPLPNPDSTTLSAVAHTQAVPSCVLYDQILDSQVTSYLELLEHNTTTVISCLTKESND